VIDRDRTTGMPAVASLPGQDFAMEKLLDCPLMVVDVSTGFLRPCMTTTYYANWCNQGSATATNASVVLTLDTAFSNFQTSMPYATLGPNSFEVALGNIPPDSCGQFSFTVTAPCSLPFVPTTHCVTAHILPDSFCGAPHPAWTGAEVEVDGWCNGNDTIWFLVRNTGTGNMQSPSGIWVVEDDILRQQGQVQLGAGQDSLFYIVGNGATWTTMVDQVANFPWPSIPRASVEACGLNGTGGVSTGFVTQFEDDDRYPWLSIDCTQLTAAIDPNDKTGYPNGFGPTHRIYPNGEMEYRIRFQNTGTDTAFTVIINDTLASHLDPQTFVSGASSHPYSVRFLPGNAVEWKFEHILLPDSNVNEPLSHGFVRFRIEQNANLPNGTQIENTAGIIFDFMPPVITNTTLHTIGELELVVSMEEQQEGAATQVTVYPNPCVDVAHFDLGRMYRNVEIGVYSLDGKMLRKVYAGSGRKVDLERGNLPAGLYIFRITATEGLVGSGKLLIQQR
ncbi:MAG: T9SS type A sorting domain-containing protein, partial [Bacteroidota bacterium]